MTREPWVSYSPTFFVSLTPFTPACFLFKLLKTTRCALCASFIYYVCLCVRCGANGLRTQSGFYQAGCDARSLSTNAKKVTVSVLYWYGKLSSHYWLKFLEWFWKESKIFFCLFYYFTSRGPHPTTHKNKHKQHMLIFKWFLSFFSFVCVFACCVSLSRHAFVWFRAAQRWVRPYLVESTTSRPICEVKQLQA